MSQTKEPVELHVVHSYTIYHGENAWTVVRYRNIETGAYFVACGTDLPTATDSQAVLYGEWAENPQYGKQFKVQFYEAVLPTTLKGFTSYVKSLKCGIGNIKAVAIYQKFGENVWDIIENNPERLLEVHGIKGQHVDKLVRELRTTRGVRHLMNLFRGQCSVTPAKAKKLLEKYGDAAEGIVMCEPYKLCELSGFKFPEVDALAHSSGIAFNPTDRYVAAVEYLYNEMTASGHTCLPIKNVRQLLVKALKDSPEPMTMEQAGKAVNASITEGKMVCKNDCLFSQRRLQEETFVAANVIARILDNNSVQDVDAFIEQYQKESGVTLAEKQADGVRMVMRHSFSILTGGPGTGKTTTIRAILSVHQLVYGNRSFPVLLAPTGKAARRMSEATEALASTIHSAISYIGDEDGEILLGSNEMLEGNLFIVDEASMLDLSIAYLLLKKIPDDARVVFVGDPDQLPSVGSGRVLLDMITSEVVPVTKLDVIYRQGADSPIIHNAHAINRGDIRDMIFDAKQFRFFGGTTDPNSIISQSVKLYQACVKHYGIDNVVLLCPYRTKTALNVNTFNRILQSKLNPPREGEFTMKVKNLEFRAGDRVMQLKNTPIAKNGDTGYVVSIERRISQENQTEYEMVANIEWNADGVIHPYSSEAMMNVDLAYCTTVHKSQGSEYNTVLLICSSLHTAMLRRNVVYTGVTRAKQNVAIIGDLEAFIKAVSNNTADVRWTTLTTRLVNGMMKVRQSA